MNTAGHVENTPSEDITDEEKKFLRRFSLKKVTVPKNKLKDVVNLTVVNNEDQQSEQDDQSAKQKNQANTSQKQERLEYRDLSKVIKSKIPWWLGTRIALNNLKGQRLVSLVEEAEQDNGDDEEENVCKNKRLQAGIEKIAVAEASQSFEMGEILSESMKVRLTEQNISVDEPAKVALQLGTLHFLSEDKILVKKSNEERVKFNSEASDKIDSQNVADDIEGNVKTPTSVASTEVAWIEERLNRVQYLLTSLEDLRLQSGCEKCRRRSMEGDCVNEIQGARHKEDYKTEQNYSTAGVGSSNTAPNYSYQPSSCRCAGIINYAKDLVKSASQVFLCDFFVARICKCDLDAIETQIAELYSFIKNLCERQTEQNDKCEFEHIMRRLNEILKCFQKFTRKIMRSAESMERNLKIKETQSNTVKNDLQQPKSAATTADSGKFIKTSFLPCFSYNPSTGECKYQNDSGELEERFGCSGRGPCLGSNIVTINLDDLENCDCCILPPRDEKKRCPSQLKEILSYIGTTHKNHEVESKTIEKKTSKKPSEKNKEKEKVVEKRTKPRKSKEKSTESSKDKRKQQSDDEVVTIDEREVYELICNCSHLVKDNDKKEPKSLPGILFKLMCQAKENERLLCEASQCDVDSSRDDCTEMPVKLVRSKSATKVGQDKRIDSNLPQKGENSNETNAKAKAKAKPAWKKPKSFKIESDTETVAAEAPECNCDCVVPLANCQKAVENLAEDIGSVCKDICDESFKQLSDNLKSVYNNPSDPEKQMCEIPCRTLCDICKKSCDNAVEKFKTLTGNNNSNTNTRSAGGSTCTIRNEKIAENVKNEKDATAVDISIEAAAMPIKEHNFKKSIHLSLPHLNGVTDECLENNTKPKISFKVKETNPNESAAVVAELVESLKNINNADVVKVESLCECCYCEGVPPITEDLDVILQNRLQNRERGTVYLKFTMSANGCFHIQMATINNEVLGCFYATETAVMAARRKNGFDGFITLSVIEPSNTSCEINHLVDHAFMVVQQERKKQANK